MINALFPGRKNQYCSVKPPQTACKSEHVGKFEQLNVIDVGGGWLTLIGNDAQSASLKKNPQCAPDSAMFKFRDAGSGKISMLNKHSNKFCSDTSSGIMCQSSDVGAMELFTAHYLKKTDHAGEKQWEGSSDMTSNFLPQEPAMMFRTKTRRGADIIFSPDPADQILHKNAHIGFLRGPCRLYSSNTLMNQTHKCLASQMFTLRSLSPRVEVFLSVRLCLQFHVTV